MFEWLKRNGGASHGAYDRSADLWTSDHDDQRLFPDPPVWGYDDPDTLVGFSV